MESEGHNIEVIWYFESSQWRRTREQRQCLMVHTRVAADPTNSGTGTAHTEAVWHLQVSIAFIDICTSTDVSTGFVGAHG